MGEMVRGAHRKARAPRRLTVLRVAVALAVPVFIVVQPTGVASRQIRLAAASEGVLAIDMPSAAQTHRVYDDYLAELARTDPAELRICAFSVVGPRNRIDKFTKHLALLS